MTGILLLAGFTKPLIVGCSWILAHERIINCLVGRVDLAMNFPLIVIPDFYPQISLKTQGLNCIRSSDNLLLHIRSGSGVTGTRQPGWRPTVP